MGSPYLSSGESITMTTSRIGVGAIPYDVMLTTRRLTLIDSRYARFEPLMVAFSDIETVKSGSASTGEPVIILTYADATGETKEMVLIFSQQPGEYRRHERDLWVKKLMESIIAEREYDGETRDEREPVREEIRPTVRRWVAPEGVMPHAPAPENLNPELTLTITPDAGEDLLAQAKKSRDARIRQNGMPGKQVPQSPPERNAPGACMPEPIAIPPHIAEGQPIPKERIPADQNSVSGGQGTRTGSLDRFSTIVIAKPPSEWIASPPQPQVPDLPISIPKIPEETLKAAVQSLIPPKPAGVPSRVPVREEQKSPSEEPHIPASSEPEKTVVPAVETLPNKADRISNTPMESSDKKAPEAPAEPPQKVGIPGIPPETRDPERITQKTDADIGAKGQRTKAQKPRETPPSGYRDGRTIWLVIAILAAAAVVILIGIAFFSPAFNPGPASTSQGTEISPQVTPPPAITQNTIAIPAEGAGFLVIYDGDYAGVIGNPGRMKMAAGSGTQFFAVQRNDGPIQATIRKQDNTGKTLTIEAYNNGTRIATTSVRTPAGSIDMLIDARTGLAPGLMTIASPGATVTLMNYA